MSLQLCSDLVLLQHGQACTRHHVARIRLGNRVHVFNGNDAWFIELLGEYVARFLQANVQGNELSS
jgi:hypothetical protein